MTKIVIKQIVENYLTAVTLSYFANEGSMNVKVKATDEG